MAVLTVAFKRAFIKKLIEIQQIEVSSQGGAIIYHRF